MTQQLVLNMARSSLRYCLQQEVGLGNQALIKLIIIAAALETMLSEWEQSGKEGERANHRTCKMEGGVTEAMKWKKKFAVSKWREEKGKEEEWRRRAQS